MDIEQFGDCTRYPPDGRKPPESVKKIVKKAGATPTKSVECTAPQAGIAQLVERNLAKVEVASSSLVSRSKF